MISTGQLQFSDICQNRHRGNPESIAANLSVVKSKAKVRGQILALMIGGAELTVDELAERWGTTPNAISGRWTELKKMGLIKKIGTRPTRTGCQAGVYAIV